LAIIFSPLNPKEIKRISEAIERRILKATGQGVSIVAISLLSVSLLGFWFSSIPFSGGFISAKDLFLKHHLLTAQTFLVLHVLSILVLAAKFIPDRIRFATLFTVINVGLSFGIFFEAERKISGYSGQISGLNILSSICLMLCLILLGVEAMKTEPKFFLFKATRYIGAKIQYFYDNYSEKDARVAIKEFMGRYKRRKKT